jgi:hypothetical protein
LLISIAVVPARDTAWLLKLSVPVAFDPDPAPGDSVPPLETVAAPVVPVPASVPPLAVTALFAIETLTDSTPPEIVVAPA